MTIIASIQSTLTKVASYISNLVSKPNDDTLYSIVAEIARNLVVEYSSVNRVVEVR